MKKKYDEEVPERYCRECNKDYVREHFQFIDLCNTCYDKLFPPKGLEYLRQFWQEKIVPEYPRHEGESNAEWIARVNKATEKPKKYRRTNKR